MANFTTDSISLHYERSGREGAQTLILSTSLGATLEMWDPQRKAFEQNFDLIRYDMRGHGQSTIAPGPYSIEMLANDVLALMESLDLSNVIFCGISIGGAIGQWLAINAPERFCGFVLSNTAAKIGTLEGWTERIAAVELGGVAAIADRSIQGWLTAQFREAHPEIAANLKQMLLSCNPAGYIAACAAVRDFDFRNALHAIRKPVCILAGTHDGSTTVADAVFLRDSIADASLIELQAAHISNVEASDAFNAAVLNFVSGHSGS